MRPKGHHTLSRNTALFVLFICISVVALELWHEWSQRDLTISHTQEDALNLAVSLGKQADDALAAVDGTVSTRGLSRRDPDLGISRIGWLFPVSAGNLIGIPSKLLGNLAVADPRSGRIGLPMTILVFDAAGKLIASSQPMPMRTLEEAFPDLATRLQKAGSSQSQLVAPIRTPRLNEWGIAMGRSVYSAAGVRSGTVVATLPGRFFSDFYRQFITNWMFSVGMITRDGFVVASGVDTAAMIGKRVPRSADLTAILASAQSGPLLGYTQVSHSDIVGSFLNLSRFQLGLVVTADLDAALVHWRRDGAIRFLLALTFALAIGILGFWLSDQIGAGRRAKRRWPNGRPSTGCSPKVPATCPSGSR